MKKPALTLIIASAALGLSGCGLFNRSAPEAATDFSQTALQVEGIGVNAFLWRASLDVLDFAALASADPWGGVILTDWYTDPEAPDERLKATVYILDTRLRADGLRVVMNRQVSINGQWVDEAVNPDAAVQVENAILTRARQLRIATLD
jgi:hypothetical protein